jgi:hypothetical protein
MMVKEVHGVSMNIERNTDLYMEYLELAAVVAFLEWAGISQKQQIGCRNCW